MSCGWHTGLSDDEWDARYHALPEHVQQAIHEHAPLLAPRPDEASGAAIRWAVIAAEAALGTGPPGR